MWPIALAAVFIAAIIVSPVFRAIIGVAAVIVVVVVAALVVTPEPHRAPMSAAANKCLDGFSSVAPPGQLSPQEIELQLNAEGKGHCPP
jgi:hypothetical protein